MRDLEIVENKQNEYFDQRILLDVTAVHTWLLQGVMVGIARVCVELYRSLQKFTDVVLVSVAYENGIAELREVDDVSYAFTGKSVEVRESDIFFSPDFQIRGVQVPVNQPTIKSIPGMGSNTFAVIHDILPITLPEYFEKPTVEGMPDFVINILKNYKGVICVSKAVCDSVKEYFDHGSVAPLNLALDLCSEPEQAQKYMISGWYGAEPDGIWSTNYSTVAFYTGYVGTDITVYLEYLRIFADCTTSVCMNGHEVARLEGASGWASASIAVSSRLLCEDGVQTLSFRTEKAKSPCQAGISEDSRVLGIKLRKLRIAAFEQDPVPVRKLIKDPVRISYVHHGFREKEHKKGAGVDRRLTEFLRQGKSFLMVGTIEPRKGCDLVYNTFERMWEKGFGGKLCLVGRTGWAMHDFVNRIRQSKWYGSKLLFCEAASDATLDYAYNNCTALIQASADEGFGLPLIEAGNYGIPVLCSDIPVFREVGKEQVLYFDRSEKGLEQAIDGFLQMDKDEIPDSGAICKKSWDDVARQYMDYFMGRQEWLYTLMPDHEKENQIGSARKKAVLLMTFPVYPPQGGGQARVFGLYKNLAKAMDISIIASGNPDEVYRKKTIAPGLTEIVVPKSDEHRLKEVEIEQNCGYPASDISMMLYEQLTPLYAETVKKEGEDADYIILCHPYLYPLAKRLFPDKQFIYEAQDVEYLIKKGMYHRNKYTEKILEKLLDTEKECCEKSGLIVTCSEEDKASLLKLYGTASDKVVVVPNGVDTEEIAFTGVEERLANKKQLGVSNEKIGLFMGSWHGPNLEAAEAIIKQAPQCPRVKFILMGSQCLNFKDRTLPPNVGLAGFVSDEEKAVLFKTADFALNPIESGSGTNLKIFDYMAAGIPVISSSFGTRGIDNKDCFVIAETDDLSSACTELDLNQMEDNVVMARKYVEDTFDWAVISKIYLDGICQMCGNRG